jgi:hypothetical protein
MTVALIEHAKNEIDHGDERNGAQIRVPRL